MTDATVPLEEIDLSSHDAFVERVPHEWFRTLRHEAPVYFNPEPDGPGRPLRPGHDPGPRPTA